MLCPDLRDVLVYLHRAPVDMRKQCNGLAALVRAVIQELWAGASRGTQTALRKAFEGGGSNTCKPSFCRDWPVMARTHL